MSSKIQNNELQNDELLNAFFQEGLEFVEAIESNLLNLVGDKSDREKLADAFRLVHSLKGNAGFMEQSAIEKLAHAEEYILDALKNSSTPIEQRTRHLLIEATDFLKRLVCREVSGSEPEMDDLLENLSAEILLIQDVTSENKSTKLDSNIPDNFFDLPEKSAGNNEAATALNLLTELQRTIYQLGQPDNRPDNSILNPFVDQLLDLESDLKSPTITALLHKSSAICAFYGKQTEIIPEEMLYLLSDLTDLLDGSLLNLQAGNSPEINDLASLLAPLDAEIKKVSPELAQIINTPLAPKVEQVDQTRIETAIKVNDDKLQDPDKINSGLSAIRQTDIRVNLEKLDELLDLTGELVIAGSLIINSSKKGEDELEKAVEVLNRIIRDLQETTMNMRLLPFSIIFGRMQKLVYSLSKKAGKRVRLIANGENTEVDKSLLEAISDPLVHLIRNAVDHGIEESDERISANKPAEGVIKLEASVTGSEIQLLIKDDGRGIDPKKIRAKAIEKDLISANDELSEVELFNLIFLPGFSTAEKVTEISGRGVGMDVVKRNIEKIKGKIKISSQVNVGTEIRITIPLTLTILEGLLIRTGTNQYIIPLDSIIESFIVTAEEITEMPDGVEFIRKRNKLYPVIRLHKLHKISNTIEDLTKGVLLLVKSTEKEAMLFIEEIIGQETTVIKSLPDYLGNLKTISGCAILGSGDVCQILHIPAIIES